MWTKGIGNAKVKAVDGGTVYNIIQQMKSKRNNIVSHGEMEKRFDNKKPEDLEWEFDHFDVDNSYPASPFKGPNIVDLDFVHKQLLDHDGHKVCKTTLSLTQYRRERLIHLTSILYLSLQNCSTVTMVKTSIHDVNTKCAADTYTRFLL